MNINVYVEPPQQPLIMTMMMMNCFCDMVDRRRCLALFQAGTIVRDPHHHESPTHHEQDLNLRIT